MLQLGNDYGKGAAPEILSRIVRENNQGHSGYGVEDITRQASERVLYACGLDEGLVCFLGGGTQTNIVAIDWLARPGEGVICTREAHINVHEAGAIEACGHKVMPIDNGSDRLSADDIAGCMEEFFADATWPHMVIPGVVYISMPTELGSLYSLSELQQIRSVCDRFNLRLYADGARLAYALGAPSCDVSLADLARLTDAFYIGGTKCGALFGEALVLPKIKSDMEKQRMFNHVKRHGALLAKGWLTALQFDELMRNDYYLTLGRHAVEMAECLRDELTSHGIKTWRESPTNQQFFVVPEHILQKMEKHIIFDIWGVRGVKESIIRLVTDWSTTRDDIHALSLALSNDTD